jgi:hypothetical protein
MDPKKPSDSPTPETVLPTSEPLVPSGRRDDDFTDISKINNSKDNILDAQDLSGKIQVATNVNEPESSAQQPAKTYLSLDMQQLE